MTSEEIEKIMLENKALRQSLGEELREKQTLINVIKKLVDLIGISENGVIKPEYMSDNAPNPINSIVQAVGGISLLMTKANMPGKFGLKYKEELNQKIGFVMAELYPLLKKYASA
jgi:hypothetical protein